jgi:hypothetical protein
MEVAVMKWILTLALLFLGGCQYDFAIVQPADRAAVIGEKKPLVVVMAPAEYHFQAAEGRLVMEVHNTGADSLEIDGQRSAVVDPTGQSHPLAGQLIPKDAFVRLILPPMHYDRGPGGFLHVGVVADAAGGASQSSAPATQVVYLDELDNPDHWDWHDDDNIRVELTIRRGSETFVHDFEFHRHKL